MYIVNAILEDGDIISYKENELGIQNLIDAMNDETKDRIVTKCLETQKIIFYYLSKLKVLEARKIRDKDTHCINGEYSNGNYQFEE